MIKTNIKQLPLSERPYEKCLKYGASSLSDAELLAVIIRTGTKKENSIQLASRVINEIPGQKNKRIVSDVGCTACGYTWHRKCKGSTTP